MSTTKEISRRTVMTCAAAALPAVAVLPAISVEATIEPDPIIAAAYDVVLEDLRAKRDQVDQTIKTLEAERRDAVVTRDGRGGRLAPRYLQSQKHHVA